MRAQGLTAIELLVTISILSIVAATALPSFARQIRQNQVKTAASELLQAIQYTRGQAVAINQRVAMQPIGDWSSGWEIFIDADNDTLRSTTERLLVREEISHPIKIYTGQTIRQYIAFLGTGEGIRKNGFLANTIHVCSTDGSEAYALTINKGGRTRLSRTEPSSCK